MVSTLGNPGVLVVDGSNLSHMSKSASKATLARINAATPHTTAIFLEDDTACTHAWFFQQWLKYLSTAFGRPHTTVVAFDNPGPTLRMQRNPNYLAKRHSKQNAPRRANHHQQQRHPLHRTAADLGCVVAYPQHGWDADDAIACTVTHIVGTTHAEHVVVASADEDMCSVVMDDRVVWAQLALPGQPASPLGMTAWTRDNLTTRVGYDPVLHGDFLAMTGKPEAGLRGCGIGARSAKALLKQHGNMDAVLAAAAAGKLAGHTPKVLAALEPPAAALNPAVALMLANRALTTLCADVAAVLPAATIAKVDAAIRAPPPPRTTNTVRSLPTCWHHPAAVVRRMAHTSLACLPQLQAQLQSQGTPTETHCVSPLGSAIDLGMLDDAGSTLKVAGVVLTPWDIHPEGWRAAAALPEQRVLGGGVPGCLSPGLRAALRLLQREMEVVLYKLW